MIGSIGRINPYEAIYANRVMATIAEVSDDEKYNGLRNYDGFRQTDTEAGMPTHRDYVARVAKMVALRKGKKDKVQEEKAPKEEVDNTPIGWKMFDEAVLGEQKEKGQDGMDVFSATETREAPTPDTSFTLEPVGSDWLFAPELHISQAA